MDEFPLTLVIVVTTAAFFTLAAILLVPVYRFLRREEEESKNWTSNIPKRDSGRGPTGNGSGHESPSERPH